MATTVHARRAPDRGDWVKVGVGLLVICVGSYVLTRLSLDAVPGVIRHGRRCCSTDFVNEGPWLWLGVMVVAIWWVTRYSLPAALLAVAVPTYATFHIATTIVQRYDDTGSGDGLEVLSYVVSIVHLLLFAAAAGVGVLAWRRRQRAARTTGEGEAVHAD